MRPMWRPSYDPRTQLHDSMSLFKYVNTEETNKELQLFLQTMAIKIYLTVAKQRKDDRNSKSYKVKGDSLIFQARLCFNNIFYRFKRKEEKSLRQKFGHPVWSVLSNQPIVSQFVFRLFSSCFYPLLRVKDF